MMAATAFTRSLSWCKSVYPRLYRNTKLMNHKRKCTELSSPLIAARTVTHHSFPYPDIPNTEAAKTFVVNLDDHGRSLLYKELHRVEQLENKSVPSQLRPPSRSDLWKIFVFNGVPFVGFGLLDNFVMIVAGEYIDATLGAALGISTMAAAGLGNLVSDVIGIGSCGYIEAMACNLGITSPDITPEQANMWNTRWTTAMGRAVGISIGCMLGMFPLLFIKRDEDEPAESATSSSSGESQRQTNSGGSQQKTSVVTGASSGREKPT